MEICLIQRTTLANRHAHGITFTIVTTEQAEGHEEAPKDRPCAVVLVTRAEGDVETVFVLPITSQPPAVAEDAEPLSEATRRRLGLQAEPCWVVLTEVNRFIWPGPDVRPVVQPSGSFCTYGLLPAQQFRRIRDAVLRRARNRTLRAVSRSA